MAHIQYATVQSWLAGELAKKGRNHRINVRIGKHAALQFRGAGGPPANFYFGQMSAASPLRFPATARFQLGRQSPIVKP